MCIRDSGNKIKIIGVGGVDSGISAYNKFIAGASYVQLYTGMVYEGPYIIKKILDELREILISKKIKNLPKVFNVKQGGLLDILVDQNSGSKRTVYICYSSKITNGSSTSLLVGEIKENELIKKKVLFRANNISDSGVHFGCRLAILGNEIFMSIGDRGNRYEAQDANSHAGSVIRVNKYDGSTKGKMAYNSWPAEVYTKGHRNPQGMAINSKTNEIWVNEHGPKGGDEINVLKPGKNYGWPIVTYGEEYWGGKIGQGLSLIHISEPTRPY
mgnify:CR=1 FL=1